MSSIVSIYYTGKDGNAKQFAQEMVSKGIVEKVRNEEALDIHHTLPLMNKIKELRKKYDLHMEVEKYELIKDSKDERYIRK